MRRPALALILGCLLLVAGASALDGYDYYQTIEYAGCDQSVYQQDIVIHRSTGTAYNETAGGLETWHIFVGEHCREDYGDIRFTNSTGAELTYYLWPDYTSSVARFAVRLAMANSGGYLTVCYGNPSVTTTSLPIPLTTRYTTTGAHTYPVPDGITSVNVLVVAGGGGGEWVDIGGGGGAGGLIEQHNYPVSGTVDVVVGDGGDGRVGTVTAKNGGNSSFGDLIAIGGGAGGASGGSGGGGRAMGGIYATGGSGTPEQGYSGGAGYGVEGINHVSGGGGGAGGVGIDANWGMLSAGNGGSGKMVWGNAYAGGGGGGSWSGVPGSGVDGGGNGSRHTGAGTNGSPNSGGGGGGGPTGGKGGSGIVIVCIGVPYSATPPAALAFSGEQSTAAPPATAFTAAPAAGLAPLTVQFTDTSTGSPTSWFWSFGDGNTSTTQNPQHTYTAPGTYSVTLTATNEYGSDYELKPDYITIYGPITAQFSATPTGGTAPLTVTFTDLSTGGPTSWLWDFGDGNTSTAQNPAHTYTTAGTHTVTLTASHPYDSDTETKTSYITVAVLQPFPGLTLIPRDLAGNGLYTDINGNNRLDYNDLTVFFQHLAWAKTAQPIACFDFNGNGWLDYNDVITLFSTIMEEHT